jgi:hypothetical protein
MDEHERFLAETTLDFAGFLSEIENVERKYGITISHEDSHGCFILRRLNEHDIAHLRFATREQQ